MQNRSKRKTINLLDPLGPPSDTWTALYSWVFTIGRYLMLIIEIIVLVVFFSRFILDKQNRDLTEEINDKTLILSNSAFRKEEAKYKNLQVLFLDLKDLSEEQLVNSSEVSAVISAIPNGLTLDSFTFNSYRMNMTLVGTDLTTIKDYEFSLRQNPSYKNVTFTVSRSGQSSGDYDVSASFILASRLPEDGKL